MRHAFTMAAVLFLATTTMAWAAETATLKPNLRKGDTWVMTLNNKIDAKSVMGNQTNNQVRIWHVKVVEARNGIATKLSVRFDEKCTDNNMKAALAGKTIVVTRDANGLPVIQSGVEANLKPLATQELSGVFPDAADTGAAGIPTKPLKVGDSWKPDMTETLKTLPAGSTAEATAKVVAIEQVEGREAVKISSTAKIVAASGGESVENNVASTAWYDAETAKMVKQAARINMSGQSNGGQFSTNINTTLTAKLNLVPRKDVDEEEDDNKKTNPLGDDDKKNPLDDDDDDNPLGKDDDDDGNPLEKVVKTTVYTDGSLTLTLKSDGSTGSVELGGTTYPIKATRDGDTITGKFFRANGKGFDFTATVAEDLVVFRTGKSTKYELKRKSDNPLE